jgi:hypothetical protein
MHLRQWEEEEQLMQPFMLELQVAQVLVAVR